MLPKTLVLFASAVSVLAAPACSPPGTKDTVPTLPSTGGPKDLTNPASDLKLLHIALGFGIQNYTCSAAGAQPTATGALAVLYDVLPLYPSTTSSSSSPPDGRRSLSLSQFANLPADVLDSHALPLNMDATEGGRADPAHPGASLTDPFPAPADLAVDGISEPLRFLGHHLFNAAGVPTFLLDDGAIQLTTSKDEGVDAPASANAGPDGTGAVSWLKLSATDAAVGPAKLVYRVFTAGGNSHGCANGAGGDSTSYAATYWFYG